MRYFVIALTSDCVFKILQIELVPFYVTHTLLSNTNTIRRKGEVIKLSLKNYGIEIIAIYVFYFSKTLLHIFMRDIT